MKIWLLDPHDAVPGEVWGYRNALLLTRTLADQGHEVTYWASNFSHATKTFRSEGWGEIADQEDKIKVVLVPMRDYRKHVSIRRLLALLDFARNVLKRGKREPRPDCIIATMPTPFLDLVSVLLRRHHKTHLITDLRDLWPDLFLIVFPKWLRPLAKLAMLPLFLMRRYAFQNADGVVAVCDTYMNYAMEFAPKVQDVPRRIIYSSGVDYQSFRRMMLAEVSGWECPEKRAGEVWAVYAGTLGNAYDVDTLLRACDTLATDERGKNVKVIVAGDGPMRPKVEQFIAGNKSCNVAYLGPLALPQLCALFAKCDIGLCIYAEESTVAIPAKAFDYYAASLPIISSLKGEFMDFLKQHKIGVKYRAGDPRSLADQIMDLATNPELRKEMKANLDVIAPQFDRTLQYSKMLEILPQVGPAACEPKSARCRGANGVEVSKPFVSSSLGQD